ACHIVSAIMTITATGYNSLYWAAFVGALGNGTVEAVINPVVATMYPRHKTKWLNVLHAGWPAGLMLAGV
ncbi:MAG: MFS transporter, partial [Planctomycetales bacterium]|nr:MFS transporter [Planctomycetales bacterium]